MEGHETAAAAPSPLTRALDTIRKLRAQLEARSSNSPIAVVGIGLRLAGGIDDLDSYWKVLAEGRDLIRPLPDARKGPFAAEWDQLPNFGAYLDEVMDFDADFFGLSAEEARGLDPQQRLLLEVSWEALENAALPPDRLDGARTGLYVGITAQDYLDWQPEGIDPNWASGNGHSFAIGRLAYAMGLAGPAIAVDTACSSSLVAIHLARQALNRRECDVALAGGVNLVLSPRMTRMHHLGGTLSSDGRCRAFDARANGFSRGEGCGVVVLKRLEDALRDGDRIHAVVRGSAVNQSGRSTGFLAPNVLSQATLIETALADAGLSPADIGFVEAHGTGTSVGDAIEMEAIATALGRKNGGARLLVGSVKTNLGHLESAAGVVGVIKGILCLQHRAVPPLLHFSTLNPLIDLEGTNITLPTALEPWPDEGRRYVAVSAFGVAGTNAHVIVGAADERPATVDTTAVARGFELSARTPQALHALAARYCERLTQLPDEKYPAFAYTATFGRARHRLRARVTASDRASALAALRSLADGQPTDAVLVYEQDQRQDEELAELALPRAVIDLPHYPWDRQRYAPEERMSGQTEDHTSVPAISAEPTPSVAEAGNEPADQLLELVWREADGDPIPARPADPGRWLVCADRGGLGAALRAELTARSGSCVTVTAGDRYRRVDETHYELDPRQPEQLTALFADLRASGPFSGVVHAWGLDVQPTDEESAWRDQDSACLSALHLVQALASASLDGSPRLVLLTRGAQRVVDSDTCDVPVQASLWGLVAVVAAEHPELRPTVVDLDPARATGEAARIVDELLRPDGDSRVALRGSTRYTPVLTPRRPESPAWPRRRFDPARDDNHRLMALQPGILSSLTPTLWERTPPGPGQVEIEIAAAGLNFSDVLKAMGAYPGATGTVPLGVECAGRISAVGEGVDRFKVGDRVMAVVPSAMALYATTDAHLVAPQPATLTDEQAAAIPIAFLTALYGLSYLARLRAGEKVLIHSATGGVGLAALMVARRCGAEVFATAGTEEKREMLRQLGVRHVLDSRSLAFADEILRITGGYGVDVVLNSLTGEALVRSLGLLAPNGRFVEIGKRDIYDDNRVGLGFFKHNRSLFAVDMEQAFWGRSELVTELFDDLLRGFDSGQFTALPVTTYRYAEASDAFATMAQARHTGKLVLRPHGDEEVAIPPRRSPVRAGATYLVAGGSGAPVLTTARQLADLGARHLALVGPAGSVDGSALTELRARTVEVALIDADLASYDEVIAALDRVDATMPPLAGVVYTEGTPHGGKLLELDGDRLRDTVTNSAAAAWNLHRATANRAVDLFVLCSSAAALLGAAGQGGDAMAAALLDGLVQYRRSRGLPALSVNQEAIGALGDLLGDPRTASRVLLLDMPGDTIVHGIRVVAAEAGNDEAAEVRRKLRAVEPGRRRKALLIQHCREIAAQVLKVDAAQIDPAAPLATLGFDSMRTLELRARLESSLGVKLPAIIGWRFPTLDALAPFLAERMQIELEAAAPQPQPAAQPVPPASEDTPDLDELSEGELEALLLAKIEQLDEGQ